MTKTATEVMNKVGALFDVEYAPAGFQVNGFYTRTPLVGDKPMYKWVNRLSDDKECIPLAIHKRTWQSSCFLCPVRNAHSLVMVNVYF